MARVAGGVVWLMVAAGGVALVAVRGLASVSPWVVGFAVLSGWGGLRLIVIASRSSGQRPGRMADGNTFVVRRFLPDTVTVPRDAEAVAITVGFVRVVLDLSHAEDSDTDIEVDATVFLGSLYIRVPESFLEERITVRHAFSVTRGGLTTAPPDPDLPDPDAPTPPVRVSVVVVGLAPTIGIEPAGRPGTGH
ncbi:hypothetical protein [Amycolatopsis pigmentata]|uniref:Cell wall-active antibiotics response LiaF-like C-terminal domain-containing protein n=1 Tax=Amycolatopsis pigmentata TaxID=450801 RepID=A0ABW5FS64_9PSEU